LMCVQALFIYSIPQCIL